MFSWDFQLEYGTGDEEFCNPLGADVISDPTVMPEEFTLKTDESLEYHILFEIPADKTNELVLVYLEEFEGDDIGDIFFVNFSVDAAQA